MKPRRGRHWCKVVDNLFSSLGLDKAEGLEDRTCSLTSFLGVAGEGIDEREFEEGLNSLLYRKYLRGVGDAGTRLLRSVKSWACIEEGKAGRSVCCVMQIVRVLVMCCGIVLHTLVLEVPLCWC